MLLGRILQTFGCERLQSADNAETRVARLDHIVDIAVAGGVVGIGELVAVLLLSLIHISLLPQHFAADCRNRPVEPGPGQRNHPTVNLAGRRIAAPVLPPGIRLRQRFAG